MALISALVRKPEMLIPDKVTAGVAPQTEAEVFKTIRALTGRATIMVISHQPELVGAADVTYRLRNQQAHRSMGI